MNERIILITDTDRDRLRHVMLRDRAASGSSRHLARLQDELDRAQIIDSRAVPDDVVTMHSTFELIDLGTGKRETYTLVFPEESGAEAERLSVLAPIGTAVLGCRMGDEFEWKVPSGIRHLRISKVLFQPEAVGDWDGLSQDLGHPAHAAGSQSHHPGAPGYAPPPCVLKDTPVDMISRTTSIDGSGTEGNSGRAWIQGVPVCDLEGPVVYVTLTLATDKLPRRVCVAWSSGGLHATTPRIGSDSVTCCIPRGIFEHGARVELEVLECGDSSEPIRAWTQITALRRAAYFADMSLGRPVFEPLAEQK